MKHLPLLLISLFLIMSCEEDEEEILGLVGSWNIASITNLDNRDCTVDTDSTVTDSTESDFGEYSGTMTFTDSTATADYVFTFEFQEYCEMMGGTWSPMEGEENSCTVRFGSQSQEITETGFDEDICLGINEDVEEWPDATITWDPVTGDSKCNHNMSPHINCTFGISHHTAFLPSHSHR